MQSGHNEGEQTPSLALYAKVPISSMSFPEEGPGRLLRGLQWGQGRQRRIVPPGFSLCCSVILVEEADASFEFVSVAWVGLRL